MFLSALAEIRVGKVRVILSGFCVACLVATVTLVTAVAGLTQQAAQKYFEQETGRPGTLEMYVDFGFERNGPKPPSSAGLAAMRADFERYGITYSALADTSGKIRTQSGEILTSMGENGPPAFQMQGVDAALTDIRTLQLLGGRWLTPTDDQRLEPQLVVSKGFLANAGIPLHSGLGSVVSIADGQNRWVRSRIVGVIDIGKEQLGGDYNGGGQSPRVYLPFTAVNRMGLQLQQTMFVLRVPKETVRKTTRQINKASKGWDGVQHVGVNPRFSDFAEIGTKLRLLMVGVAVAMLLLGSLPVVVLGIFAVRQRRSEFGVHRCFGATGSDLFLTVLLEALISCFIAGALGVGAAFVVTGKLADFVVQQRYGDGGFVIDTSFPWEAAQLGLGVAVCVGLFTGLIPAWRAMQKSVIRAIRA
ncbi:ABC transporter permease [Actinocorallia lasiicapitis]